MNKYNITVIVPNLNKEYRIFVPDNIMIGNLIYMFINSINNLENININCGELYDRASGLKLLYDKYVYELITNGSVLIFV